MINDLRCYISATQGVTTRYIRTTDQGPRSACFLLAWKDIRRARCERGVICGSGWMSTVHWGLRRMKFYHRWTEIKSEGRNPRPERNPNSETQMHFANVSVNHTDNHRWTRIKSEDRNPKSERNPKAEIRRNKPAGQTSCRPYCSSDEHRSETTRVSGRSGGSIWVSRKIFNLDWA
jgi:hypothetical protein